MRSILSQLINHQPLAKEQAKTVLVEMAAGKFNASQMSAFMTVYMMRAVTLGELQGFREAMLELCIPVTLDAPVMDVCGTGGDGKNTFNISTLSSFVVAAAGQPVAKHGNYGVSSVSGSSNVLEYFGFKFTNNVDQLKRSLEEANICFMHAPMFHPAMKNVAPIRKELGVKTFFNMLGPMVNPAFPPRQLVGVFSLELARMYGYLYQQLAKEFVIVHDLNGYDEVSLTGAFKIFTKNGERILSPAELGLNEVNPLAISGGETVEASARIFRTILEGHGSASQKAVVAANAGLCLWASDTNKSLPDCVATAREALESGAALKAFKKIITLSEQA